MSSPHTMGHIITSFSIEGLQWAMLVSTSVSCSLSWSSLVCMHYTVCLHLCILEHIPYTEEEYNVNRRIVSSISAISERMNNCWWLSLQAVDTFPPRWPLDCTSRQIPNAKVDSTNTTTTLRTMVNHFLHITVHSGTINRKDKLYGSNATRSSTPT